MINSEEVKGDRVIYKGEWSGLSNLGGGHWSLKSRGTLVQCSPKRSKKIRLVAYYY